MKKDSESNLTKNQDSQVSTYQFKYVSGKSSDRGCLDHQNPDTVYGSEIFYENNQSIFNIIKLEGTENSNQNLEKNNRIIKGHIICM